MKKILFPTDFSGPSLNTLEYAKRIAEHFDAEITILHVYVPQSGPVGGTGEFVVVVPDESEMMEQLMQDFLKSAKSGGVDTIEKTITHSEVMVGFPGDEIADYASEIGADLIMMGTRTKHNIADRVFGSVTTSTIRKAKCPVWVIPENAFFKGINNILYASNHETADLKAMKRSLALARKFSADLHYVNVHELPTVEGFKEVDSLTEQLLSGKGNKTFNLKMASVQSVSMEKGLYRYIEKNDVDLLVMLTQQKSLLEQMFFVSNTCKMAFNSSVPLLVLRG